MMDAAQLQDCPDYLRDYLFYIGTIRGRSPRTVHAYYTDLKTFLRYLKHRGTLLPGEEELEKMPISDVSLEMVAAVSLSDLLGFLHYTASGRSNSATTLARKVSCLRGFYGYLNDKAVRPIHNNPTLHLDSPKIKKSLPRFLSLEESLELLSSAREAESTHRERDFCMLTIFLNCGIRLSELVGLNLSSLHLRDERPFMIVLGKGNKERMVYLNDACLEALEAYLRVRGEDAAGSGERDALFLSSRHKRISGRRVQQIVEDSLHLSGLEGLGYSVHKLRHTAATLLYQYGHVDIRVLKEILGHENIATTEIYTHVSDEQVARAAERSPLSGVRPPVRPKLPPRQPVIDRAEADNVVSETEDVPARADKGSSDGDGR